MINRLRLQNFKKYEDLDLHFSSGVNIICGPNYAGKSTILHGIMMALFGVSAVPGGSAQAWRRGASSGKVILELEIAGVEISITRTKTSAILEENGQETARGTSPVSQRVQELLGLSKADFSMIKYAAQNETSALLSFGAQALRGLIERVSGADLINDILKDLKTELSEAAGALSVLEAVDIAALEEAFREADAASAKAGPARDKAVGLEQSLGQALEEAKEELRAMQDHNTKVAHKQAAKDETEAELVERQVAKEALAKELQGAEWPSLESVQALRDEIEETKTLNRRIYELEEKQESLQLSQQEAAVALSATVDKLEIAQRDLNHAKTVAEGLAGCTAAEKQLRDGIATRRERLLARRTALTAAVCPQCKRPYDESYDREAEAEKVEILEVEIADLEQKLQVAEARVSEHIDVTKRISNLEISISHLEKSTLPELKSEIAQMAEQESSVISELSMLGMPTSEEEIQQAELQVKEMEEKREVLNAKRGRLNETVLQVQRLQAKLADIGEIADPYELSVTAVKINNLEGELRTARDLADQAKQNWYKWESEKASLLQSVAQATKTNALIAEHEKTQSDAQALIEFLKKNRETFMASVWQQFLSFASQFASNITEGAIESVTREKDAFVYVEGGEVMALDGASGAQQAIMGLGMKTALASAIPDSLNCLLLDEVTADMDEIRASTTTALLGSLSQQVIAVSHREFDRSGDYNIIAVG